MDGVIVIDKEKGYTSRDIVNIVSKELKIKKIGHAGTLDPLATGVLVLAVNQGTKIIEYLTYDEKEYIAEAKCGIFTDTLDITGTILKEQKEFILDKVQLEKVLKSFLGKQMQEVPKYSAVRVNGKRLYEYARKNEEVLLPKKEIEIKEIKLLSLTKDTFTFKVKVSKGTYIRSLIRDISSKLNVLCTMSNLRRVKEGIFDIKNAYTMKQIQEKNYSYLSLKEALSNYKQIKIEEAEYHKIKNGNKLLDRWNVENMCIFLYKEEVVGIYQKEDSILKAKKIFHNK